MRVIQWLREASRTPERVVGHIAGEPTVTEEGDQRYMIFHLAEIPGVRFRFKMFPTTPERRDGDRVEVTYLSEDGTGVVDSIFAAPDPELARRRHREYLADIKARERKVLRARGGRHVRDAQTDHRGGGRDRSAA